MKMFNSICKTWVFLALIPAMLLTSCVKEKFDVPPITVPSFTLPDGATLISIKALNARHTIGALDTINDNVYIKGIITGNDEFGNIYKALFMQDDSAGIELALNQTNLYNTYKQGQVLYVKCQGLVLGDYGGLNQLGSVYNGTAGQLAAVYIPQHLFKDGLPGVVPAPAVINNATQLTLGMLSTLVQFNNATFAEVGQPYVNPGDVNTNRNLGIPGGNIIVRTSKYANFAASILPSGHGTVVSILSIYNGAFQLTIRSADDVYGFH